MKIRSCLIFSCVLATALARMQQADKFLPKPPVFAESKLTPDVQVSPMSLEERLKRNIVPKHGFYNIVPVRTVVEGLTSGNGAMNIELTDDPNYRQAAVRAAEYVWENWGSRGFYVDGVDEYLDWSAPSYAKLDKYTNDPHYLDVARILLHDTKSMVALPGRLYGMKGIGWQQEGWRMGPGGSGRGVGEHRFWLPWISANHLYSITGLEEVDPVLFQQLAKEN